MTGNIVMRATIKHQTVDNVLGSDKKRNSISIFAEKKDGKVTVWSGNLNISQMTDSNIASFKKDLGADLNENTPLRLTLELREEETLDNYDKDE